MINFTMVGTLGKDAEYREIGQGRYVVNFNMAHTDKWKDAQGVEQSRTTWVRCAYWVNGPKIAEYLKKGGRVAVYAEEVKAHAYTDNQGEPQAQLEVTVRKLELLGGSQKSEGQPSQPSTTSTPSPSYGSTTFQTNYPGATEEDDLPF